MSCNTPEVTKSQFISALNSFGAATRSNDANLIAFSSQVLSQMVEQLTFKPEVEEQEEVTTEEPES